jgi:hypothetical protein
MGIYGLIGKEKNSWRSDKLYRYFLKKFLGKNFENGF